MLIKNNLKYSFSKVLILLKSLTSSSWFFLYTVKHKSNMLPVIKDDARSKKKRHDGAHGLLLLLRYLVVLVMDGNLTSGGLPENLEQ